MAHTAVQMTEAVIELLHSFDSLRETMSSNSETGRAALLYETVCVGAGAPAGAPAPAAPPLPPEFGGARGGKESGGAGAGAAGAAAGAAAAAAAAAGAGGGGCAPVDALPDLDVLLNRRVQVRKLPNLLREALHACRDERGLEAVRKYP